MHVVEARRLRRLRQLCFEPHECVHDLFSAPPLFEKVADERARVAEQDDEELLPERHTLQIAQEDAANEPAGAECVAGDDGVSIELRLMHTGCKELVGFLRLPLRALSDVRAPGVLFDGWTLRGCGELLEPPWKRIMP